MRSLLDERAYYERDTRQALLAGPNLLALYEQRGQLAVKERLLDWLASYHEATGGRDYDPSGELEQAASRQMQGWATELPSDLEARRPGMM